MRVAAWSFRGGSDLDTSRVLVFRNLFKVGLMTSVSPKLRETVGSKINVAQSALDYSFAPSFDEEALDLVDEALVRAVVKATI